MEAAQEEYAAARKHYELALHLYGQLRCGNGQAEAHYRLADLLTDMGEWPGAHDHAQAALGLGSSLDREIEIRNLLAASYHATGESKKALAELEKVLVSYESRGSVLGQVKTLGNMGGLLTKSGEYTEALDCLTSAFTLSNSAPDPDEQLLRVQGNLLLNLGNLYQDLRDLGKAYDYFLEVLSSARHFKNQSLEAIAVLNLAGVDYELGRLSDAHLHYARALELARVVQNRYGELSALDGLARVLLAWDRVGEAREALGEAEQIAVETEDVEGQLDVLLHLGEAYLRQGALPEAIGTFERALRLADEIGRPKAACDALRCLYQLHARLGQTGRAFERLEQLYGRERGLLNAEVDERIQGMTARFEVERAQHQAELHRLRMVAAEEARATAEAEVRSRTHSLELAQIEVVTRLAVAAEYRDDTTGDHTQRVGQLSAAIGTRLGLSPEEVELLRIAARLHDVGKIGIPDSILLKQGPLTPEEYRQMQRHTVIGARILAGGHSRLLQMAETIAQNHHEHWNGRGYPCGLSGEDIPLVARIVAVADVYDALTHRRAYKAAWPRAAALAELRAQSGQQFDPAVVREALRVLGTAPSLDAGGGGEEGPLIVRALA
ncbi:putative two-component system response regulator [Deinococcus sp. HSC-46F16]|uniref:HD domain-containing phosphohydrolase n=1 Tax=Deinococcus sp. HSC-46F16 TaxID=2910968 RepID=UPI00209F0585|nr:HD domain-containing phosphohydrolase [Deinococcus sp. HSC-46F16]MCP2014481.1 putative two-component system response regulator [Deinococcus sp. HSC-46F16]